MRSPEFSELIDRVQEALDTAPDVVLLGKNDVRALLIAACGGELPPSPPTSPFARGSDVEESSDFSLLDSDLPEVEESMPANGSLSIFDGDSDFEMADDGSSVAPYPVDSDFDSEIEITASENDSDLQDFSGEPALTAEEQEQIIQQAIDAAREASGARDSDSDFGLEPEEEDEPERKK